MSNPYDPYRQSLTNMPSAAQMGGEQPVPFARFPFYPTAPWYSTNPHVGYETRFYSTGVLFSDADYAVGTESLRTVMFDIPVRLIAINGAAIDATGAVTYTEDSMNLQYLFRLEYANMRLHTQARLAATVVGVMKYPGELGGHGYNVDQGASVQVGITPLTTNLRIDITLVCLEMRAPRNFSIG